MKPESPLLHSQVLATCQLHALMACVGTTLPFQFIFSITHIELAFSIDKIEQCILWLILK